jgi:hypothetical protein
MKGSKIFFLTNRNLLQSETYFNFELKTIKNARFEVFMAVTMKNGVCELDSELLLTSSALFSAH